jgi:hypothetical protein
MPLPEKRWTINHVAKHQQRSNDQNASTINWLAGTSLECLKLPEIWLEWH